MSSPRSGSTLLERILESHSAILGGPEPHLMTPLAHLGVWDNVDKAPYDHVLAAWSQKLFVEGLPGKEQDYWDACRAYCDTLYGRFLGEGGGETICLDKTPAYALVLPFLAKVYPDAKYVVLTRHPAAILSSYAHSFFDGDYKEAHKYNPIIERYVPALAKFLRQDDVPSEHVRYEDLVRDPEGCMKQVYEYIGVPFDADTIDYGKSQDAGKPREGLGDPIGVSRHSRPTTASSEKWVDELIQDPNLLEFMKALIDRLDPEDLETVGYPVKSIWQPLESAGSSPPKKKGQGPLRYRMQRKAIMRLRSAAKKGGIFRKGLSKVRLVCDVLLRE
jgi:hypothetical protein